MPRFKLVALLALPLAAAAWPSCAAAQDAEFAVRWDPRQGGPATPQDALHGLRLRASSPSYFEVQYLEFTPPAGLPPGFDAILRKRLTGGEAELTFKLRGDAPLPAQPTLQRRDCPLGKTKDRKDEADISFAGAGRVIKAHSRLARRRFAARLRARGAETPAGAAGTAVGAQQVGHRRRLRQVTRP